MDVDRRDTGAEGPSVRVQQDGHLGTRFSRVHGARTGVFTSFSLSRGRSRARHGSCRIRSAACDQGTNRRCVVDFDIPKHGGNARQAQPLTSTWTIAANTVS